MNQGVAPGCRVAILSAVLHGEAARDAQEGIQSVFVERNNAGGDMTFVACDVLALDGQGIMGEPWEHGASPKAPGGLPRGREPAPGWQHYPDTRPKALIAFYPSCGRGLPPANAPPLLMLLGGLDDWTPAEPCVKLAESARKVGRTVTDVLYKDARHAFDAANLRGRVHVDVARGGRGATIKYNPRAHDDAEKQAKRFLQEYLRP